MSYQLVDGDQKSIARDMLYDWIDRYFDSPQVQKMRDDRNSGTSVYMTRIKTLLASPEQRFVIAVTELDNQPIGAIQNLADVKWMSLQMRMLTVVDGEMNKVHRHSYMPKNTKAFAKKLNLIQRHPNRTEYTLEGFETVCTVALIHSNPEQPYEFRDQTACAGSIELYRTVFMML